MNVSVAVLVFALVVALPSVGHAYFGPGAGITMLGAIWGVVLAIVFALFAILAWPIRTLLRRRRKPAADAASATIAKPDAGA